MKNNIKLDSIKNFYELPEGMSTDQTIERKQYSENLFIKPEEDRTFVAVISNKSVDMDGDLVIPTGVDLSVYLKNGVLLWGHAHSSPPIGKLIGIEVTDDSINAKYKMADTTFANEIWSLVKGGFVKTNSIGFIIKSSIVKGTKQFGEYLQRTGLQVGENCARIIKEFTLMENSLVPLPSNSQALISAISTKSINISDKLIKELDIKEIPVIVVEPAKPIEAVEKVEEVKPVEPVEAVEAITTEPVTPKEEAKEEVKIELIGEEVVEVVVEEPKEPKEPEITLDNIEFELIRDGDYKTTPEDDVVIKSIMKGKII